MDCHVNSYHCVSGNDWIEVDHVDLSNCDNTKPIVIHETDCSVQMVNFATSSATALGDSIAYFNLALVLILFVLGVKVGTLIYKR